MSLSCIVDCPGVVPLMGATIITAAIIGVQLKNWLNALPMAAAVVAAAFVIGLVTEAAFDGRVDIELERFEQPWVQEQWVLFFLLVLMTMLAVTGLVSLFRSGQRLTALACFAAATLSFTAASALLQFEVFERPKFITLVAPTQPVPALQRAVDRSDFAEARKLLSNSSEWTKLELSDALAAAVARGGDMDLLRELLRRGADPNWKGVLGIAALFGRPDAVTLLIRAGADLHARDESIGLTVLHAAVGDPSPDASLDPPNVDRGAVIEILVKAGIAVDARDYWQRTALNWNLRGREAVVSTLIRLGADVNTQNSDGETPLMSNDNPKATELLLAAGANPFIKDLHGWTVRDNDDRRILFQRQAIVETVNRWISNNLAAAERARAEAERIGTSRVKPKYEPPFDVEDITPYDGGGISPVKYIGLVLVTISELAIVTLLAWIGTATLRRLGL